MPTLPRFIWISLIIVLLVLFSHSFLYHYFQMYFSLAIFLLTTNTKALNHG